MNTTKTVGHYTIVANLVGFDSSVNFTCTDPTNCALTGLTSYSTYSLVAVAIFTDGSQSSPSSAATVTLPAIGAPTLTSAAATGPTTASATASAPIGGTFTNYTFTATPLGGGSPVAVSTSQPSASFTGLTAGTSYSVVVVAYDASGNPTPTSNSLIFATPLPE